MKEPNPIKLSYVSRSAFQKVCEENKRLKADLKTICMMEDENAAVEVVKKWHTKFSKEHQFFATIKELLQTQKPIKK